MTTEVIDRSSTADWKLQFRLDRDLEILHLPTGLARNWDMSAQKPSYTMLAVLFYFLYIRRILIPFDSLWSMHHGILRRNAVSHDFLQERGNSCGISSPTAIFVRKAKGWRHSAVVKTWAAR